MGQVEQRTVAADEGELRLDRWFSRHFPTLPHGRLQKLLRTGQVRVDGRRAQSDLRLAAGQTVRVPPLPLPDPDDARPALRAGSPAHRALLRSMVMYEDPLLLVLNKPPGLAVQGGTGTIRHIDGMLDAFTDHGERPRLVHRLDRDTSGLLIVAKGASAAAAVAEAFRRHQVQKLYWALVVGRPRPPSGRIDEPLGKQATGRAERVEPDRRGRRARTAYRTIAAAGKIAAWLGLKPETGRTHQLRAHCALLGTPILGDGKYGGAGAHLPGAPRGLMLHARELVLPHPDGSILELVAPPSPALQAGLAWLGFEAAGDLPGASLARFEAS